MNQEFAQEIITDLNRSPYHCEKPASYTHYAVGENKSRGDKIEVFLQIEMDLVKKAFYIGSGSAMFTASASLMTKNIENKTIGEIYSIFEQFKSIFVSQSDNCTFEKYGELFIFCGIKQFPVRIKCTTLPWYTMIGAIENKKDTISTELIY